MSGQEITDPALIAELEKGAQSGDDVVVQALIDGRMSFPNDSRALNKPYWQNLLRQVSAKDPTFDTIDYKARSRTRQAFTSGKEAQNIASFNTLLHHIGTLEKAAGELDNYGGVFTPLNSIANRASETTGSPKLTTFRTARDAVAREAVRAFRGVGGTGADVEETVRNIPENGSPEQIRASVKTLADLLRGRIQSLGEQYTAGMGKTSDGINLLDDEAKEVLGRLSPMERRDDQAGGAAAAAIGGPPPSRSPNPPASNIDIGFGDRSAADANGRPAQSDAYVREVTQGIRDGSIADVDALTAVMAKHILFGDAEMRNDMNALATIAERVKGSEKLRGHSNTGGIDIANKTGMGLASAVIALATGHPIVAAGLAAPPLYQRLSAEVLTSKAMLRWLARTPKKPNVAAQRAHIQQLGKIASAEPAIANEVLQLQARLRSAFASPLPTQIAAEERLDRRPTPEQGRRADQPSQQFASPAH